MTDSVLGNKDITEVTPETVEKPGVDKALETPETKVEGEDGNTEKLESKDGQADKDKPVGAPEKYEDFIVPEGVELDKALMEEFVPIAKEANLTQEQAQKLADIYTKKMQASAEGQQEAWTEIRKGWVSEFKADKEIGGARVDETVTTAKHAMKEFGSPELTEALNMSGLGDHPAVIRFMYRVGKAIGEDNVLTGGRSGGASDPSKVMYPDMK